MLDSLTQYSNLRVYNKQAAVSCELQSPSSCRTVVPTITSTRQASAQLPSWRRNTLNQVYTSAWDNQPKPGMKLGSQRTISTCAPKHLPHTVPPRALPPCPGVYIILRLIGATESPLTSSLWHHSFSFVSSVIPLLLF